jgi:predicted phosphohydrolase
MLNFIVLKCSGIIVENILKTLWLTDLHVNKLNKKQYQQLLSRITTSGAEAIWLTGDIGDPPFNWLFLEDLFCGFKRTVYFLLGNHDYYHQPIDAIRNRAKMLGQVYPNAYYLTVESGFSLGHHFFVGVGGWANTGGHTLDEKTWDSESIEDFKGLNTKQLHKKLNQLAERDAYFLLEKCRSGIKKSTKQVSIFTHVPPTDAMYGKYPVRPLQEKRSVFYSYALSSALKQLLNTYPTIDFCVYSGHIHQSQLYYIGERLTGYIAEAYHPSQPLNWITI